MPNPDTCGLTHKVTSWAWEARGPVSAHFFALAARVALYCPHGQFSHRPRASAFAYARRCAAEIALLAGKCENVRDVFRHGFAVMFFEQGVHCFK